MTSAGQCNTFISSHGRDFHHIGNERSWGGRIGTIKTL